MLIEESSRISITTYGGLRFDDVKNMAWLEYEKTVEMISRLRTEMDHG
jgi:hypothetical protein